MNPHRCTVDHRHITTISIGNRLHYLISGTCLRPTPEAVVAGRGRTVASGRSRHGEPGSNIKKIPFSTRRSSTLGTPRGLFSNNGSITSHSNSVISYRLIQSYLPEALNQICGDLGILSMSSRPNSRAIGQKISAMYLNYRHFRP